MHFTKMQGIGNDYVYVNCFREQVKNPSALARRISDRHFGVGSDGLVLIEPCPGYDFRMRMFNSDGSESEMCGNASRCVARYARERGLTDRDSLVMLTGAGPIGLQLKTEGGIVSSVRVDMGEPEIDQLGVTADIAGEFRQLYCISMGNPHCVVFVQEPEALDLPAVGPLFEHHPMFPHRTNTEFVKIISEKEIAFRVWERGAGETLACGTGACAAAVASVLARGCQRELLVHLKGGDLTVTWDEKTNHIYQEGPAEFVFDGEWPDEE